MTSFGLLLFARKNYKSLRASSLTQKTIIMTTSIQTSTFNIQTVSRRRTSHSYQIIVNGEDGNYQEFEIEAESDNMAHQKADEIAQGCMIDVTFVEVYRIA